MSSSSKSCIKYVTNTFTCNYLSDCIESRKFTERELLKLRGTTERVKREMQRASEELFDIRSEASCYRDQLNGLEANLEVANKNTGVLQVNLSKLKSKVGTHRARAAGAVCDSFMFEFYPLGKGHGGISEEY